MVMRRRDSDRSWDNAEMVSSKDELPSGTWVLPHDAPHLAFLPAVWPRHAKRWVPERPERTFTWVCTDREGRVTSEGTRPVTDEEFADYEAWMNDGLVHQGLPPRPPDRTWWLRLPIGYSTIEEVVGVCQPRVTGRGIPIEDGPQFMQAMSEAIHELFSEQAEVAE
jgi:hypothetical protein